MDKNTQTALNVVAIVVGMMGLAYAAVPLYDLFCRVTGFGGTPMIATELPDEVLNQEVEVLFNSDVQPGLPWEFSHQHHKVKVKIGENKLVFFKAKNISDKPTTGIALYNVTPNTMGKYFNKTQCFCFDEQTLQPGQEIDFPVTFFISPDMVKDEYLHDIKQITLSYSFFEAKKFPKKTQ
jgi:cytochrome c oxidase assembly protein subunit 11